MPRPQQQPPPGVRSGRALSRSEFFRTGDNYAQSFGFYAEDETQVSITIQNATEIHRTRSAAMKLAIALAGISLAVFVYYLAVVLPRTPKFPLE
jgi:hypothetical protein